MVVSLLPLFFAVASAASSTGSLTGSLLDADLPLFHEAITSLQMEEAEQAGELRDEEGTEFFPLSATGALQASRFSDYVAVSWRNVLYDLKDVPRQEWFAPYVRDMVNRGIVTGYKDATGKPLGEFGPKRSVSIEEMVKMILAAAGTDPGACSLAPRNVSAIGRWSAPYIACAEDRKLSLSLDSSLDVTRPALRGEVMMTLLEAFSVIRSSSGSVAVTVSTGTDRAVGGSGTGLYGSGAVFHDVLPGMAATPAILRAASDGIIAGYKDAQGNLTGMFGPGNQITRAEVSKVLSLAIQVYSKHAAPASASSAPLDAPPTDGGRRALP